MFTYHKSFSLFFCIISFLTLCARPCFAITKTNAPAVVFITPSHDHVFLSKLYYPGEPIKGKQKSVVVMKFMSINCPPCKRELPSFLKTALWAEKIAKQNSSQIKFFVVNVDPLSKKKKMLDFMKSMNVNLDTQLLLDPYGKGAKLFNVSKIPRTFVITPDGEIAEDFLIFKDETYKDFKATIQSLLEK